MLKSTAKLPPRFPHVVKVGDIAVRIYRCKTRRWKGRQYYVFPVIFTGFDGKRQRKSFSKFSDALAEAQEIVTCKARGEVLELTGTDRASYMAAADLLRPLGLPLHCAIEEYIAARSQLHSESLLSVVKQHISRERRGDVVDKPVRQIVNELLAAKERDGLSERYIETLRSHLRRFAVAFDTNIGSIGARFIDDWLAALPIGARARNNIRMSVVTLFNFARARGYLPKGSTEAEEVRKAKDRGGVIGILTAKQLADLMEPADEENKLYFAIGAFTGLRSAELIRLEWTDVNFARGHVVVGKSKSKTATRRLVPIQPNLMQWLAPYRGFKGLIFSSERATARAIARAKILIGHWPNNALRHSYATYRLAQCNDAARVALEMGNSPQMLFRSYRELADEKDAADWFNIVPREAAARKIIPLRQTR